MRLRLPSQGPGSFAIVTYCDYLPLFCIWACVYSSFALFLVHWLLLQADTIPESWGMAWWRAGYLNPIVTDFGTIIFSAEADGKWLWGRKTPCWQLQSDFSLCIQNKKMCGSLVSSPMGSMGLVYLQLAFGRHGKLEGIFRFTYNIPFPWILWVVKCWAEELRDEKSNHQRSSVGFVLLPTPSGGRHCAYMLFKWYLMIWFSIYIYIWLWIYDMISYYFVDVIVSTSLFYTAILIQI